MSESHSTYPSRAGLFVAMTLMSSALLPLPIVALNDDYAGKSPMIANAAVIGAIGTFLTLSLLAIYDARRPESVHPRYLDKKHPDFLNFTLLMLVGFVLNIAMQVVTAIEMTTQGAGGDAEEVQYALILAFGVLLLRLLVRVRLDNGSVRGPLGSSA